MYEVAKTPLARQQRIDPERVTFETQIKKDFRADSIDILQRMMRHEDDYGIVIPNQELAKFETDGDVVNFLDIMKK